MVIGAFIKGAGRFAKSLARQAKRRKRVSPAANEAKRPPSGKLSKTGQSTSDALVKSKVRLTPAQAKQFRAELARQLKATQARTKLSKKTAARNAAKKGARTLEEKGVKRRPGDVDMNAAGFPMQRRPKK